MNGRTARAACCGLLSLAALLAGGCIPAQPLKLTSYRDVYFPETYDIKLDSCVYYQDASGDYHLAGHALRAADPKANTPAFEQWLHLHVFWKPRPGKTRDNPTSMDATLRYAVRSEKGAAVYTGTAFSYPAQDSVGSGATVSIESSRMKPSEPGATTDWLGECRLLGKVKASRDPNRTVDFIRQIDLMAAPRPD